MVDGGGVGSGIGRVVSSVVIVAAVVVGVGMILVAVTLGDCSAFGGRCPADPEPLRDDVFGMAAFGAALATGIPVVLRRASWRRFGIGVAVAVVSAVVVGLLARSIAHS